jgi:3-hydroxy acid dehydrogenase/malonic semialdehyde reductase
MDAKSTALLTGAAGGMGTAIAKALFSAGHRVVLVDRDDQKLAALARDLGPQTTTLTLDITDGKRVDRLLELLPDAFRHRCNSR